MIKQHSKLSVLSGLVFAVLAISGCEKTTSTEEKQAANDVLKDAGLVVLRPEDVSYIPLNPARGDAAPQAGVLWGDIRENVASGTLLRFADGFSSPPHIHNITYRAVVIEGDMHNDTPDAEQDWMGPGSFWVQAAGEDHITEAKPGSASLALLEILEGPYLVEPSEEAFSSSDESINIKAAELDWLSANELSWIRSKRSNRKIETAHLWGDPSSDQPNGRFLRLERGAEATLRFENSVLKAVVIAGTVEHQLVGTSENATLDTGSYFSTNASVSNSVTCAAETCILYLRT